ncbi:MAG: hypothetical protein EOO46_15050 [Flavobacterium sp.]|nr:MAG: hypothetical protein EOO46_15050 [Flavobacterium sp.]
MKVYSKLRKEFMIKQILGFGLGIIVIPLCFYNSFYDGGFDYQNSLFQVGCILSIIFIVFAVSLLLPKSLIKEIVVFENGIEISFFSKNQSQFIKYDEISNIYVARIRQQVKSGYITDGYLVSNLQLKSGEEILISHDEFENYNEIMSAINSNRHAT